MSSDLNFQLHSVGVVITAQDHNPSVLTSEFLLSSDIVPKAWEVQDAINVPPLSLVRFRNGMQWTLDQSRLVITEACEPKFQDSYRVHSSAIKYLQKIDYVPYRSLGLNCGVSMVFEDPARWFVKQFLKEGPWMGENPRLLSMIPTFTFDSGGLPLNLAFGISQERSERAISVDCNVHHQGPLNAAELREAIAQWEKHQGLIIQTLDMLSGKQ